jgi:uncharacterized protein (UPF0332 family)
MLPLRGGALGQARDYHANPRDADGMNDVAQAWLRKSKCNLESADILRKDGTSGGSVDRAYFAMFDAAKAMGAAVGKDYPPCSKWLDAFAEVFVETGRINPSLFEDLREAYRLRRVSVYSFKEEDCISRDVAELVFLKARGFVGMAEGFLRELGHSGEDS